MEIVNGHHPIMDLNIVLQNLGNIDAEQVSKQLDYYNGESIMIDGVSHHPFNDPRIAARLNARYCELTGQDHPRYVSEVPKVIDKLLSESKDLIQNGAYTPFYFDDLIRIKEGIIKKNRSNLGEIISSRNSR